jgi:hypothetical protein
MVTARVPHLIDSVIAKKRQELADPDMLKLYRLLSEALDWPADDPRIVEIADVLERLMARALDAGEELSVDLNGPFVTYSTRRCSRPHRLPGGCWRS